LQYGDLADVPPELEWLANITNPAKTVVADFGSRCQGSTVRCLAADFVRPLAKR
jgi:hypothetical protein